MDRKARVCHYTSREGLIGIVNHKCLWATSILYLNDSQEFHHLSDLVTKWIDNTHSSNTIGESNDSLLLEGSESAFVQYLKHKLLTGTMKALNTFVISFSSEGDDLNQWRAYGSGGGYSVGFEVDTLIELANTQCFEFMQCVYEDTEKEKLINLLMLKYLDKFRDVKNSLPSDDLFSGMGFYKDQQPSQTLENIGDEFFNEAQIIAAKIKHAAFSKEFEWRLVSTMVTENTDYHFRSDNSMMIPYVKLHLNKNDKKIVYFSHIVTGPSPHIQLNAISARQLCRTDSGVMLSNDVFVSSIPYRDW